MMSIRNSKNFYQKLTRVNKNHQTLSIWWSPCFFIPWVILTVVLLVIYNALPTGILQQDEQNHPDRFIGERAQIYNREITDIGPKVVGSHLNEVVAIEILRRQAQDIINGKDPVHNIEIDVQVASGSFQLFTMITVYQNIQNFIVRLSPSNGTAEHSLLLNTHFDSVPVSPGGGDSCTFVSVMMETLRVMSKSTTPFRHNVVFLFNGAEENGLHGSHAFITQHRWAQNVKAFINMDAAGSGGREVLFQSTIRNQWMMNYYNRVALRPMSTSLGEEIFQTGVIPSDTDFRIFRDYGRIPGMDFAVYKDGYVYHTRNDISDMIPIGTFQNGGDNILALTRAVANSPELSISDTLPGEKLVFYDFLGWFMISYNTTIAIVINVIVALVALVAVALSLLSFKNNLDLKWCHLTLEFTAVFLIQILSVALAIGVVLLLATIFDAVSRSMSWFSNKWLVFGLFYCPLIFCLGIGPATYVSFKSKKAVSLSCYIQMFLHSQCIVYIILILVMTGMGLRSAFLLLFALVFYSLTTFINLLSRLQSRGSIWILVHFIGQVIPFLFYAYYAVYSLDNFIPIQGRSGPTTNPEILVAIVAGSTGILLAGQLIQTLCIFRRPVIWMCGFLFVFFVFIILMATPLGFPYREQLSQQRFWIFHTERHFYNFDMSVRRDNSGYFMLPMDRHSNHFVEHLMPEFANQVSSADECENEMFCGAPLYMSRMIEQSYHSTWIPSAKPVFPMPTNLELVETAELGTNQNTRFRFRLNGPDRVAIFLRALNGSEILDWSFSTSLPKKVSEFQNGPLYFIFIGHGKVNLEYNFFIDIQRANPIQPSIALTTVGHYTHHDEYQTAEFQNFINSFPPWAHVTPWMCSYTSYLF
ncbi:hypothetical protein HA402_011805 [Bradysia odoriphaga]|nr:hypothetical protein HA402_011805 [Bradysia odoriphaga]